MSIANANQAEDVKWEKRRTSFWYFGLASISRIGCLCGHAIYRLFPALACGIYTGISLKSWRSPFARLSCFFEKGCTAPKRGSYIFRRAADTKRLTTTSATRTASSFLLFFVLPELIPSTLSPSPSPLSLSLSHCRVCTCTGSCTANANSMFLLSKYVLPAEKYRVSFAAGRFRAIADQDIAFHRYDRYSIRVERPLEQPTGQGTAGCTK